MFHGSLVALVTPYQSNLNVDYEALRRLVRFQVDSGTNGIVVLGTTGEHLLLSQEEKKRIVKVVVDEVAGKTPVIVNVGVASTRDSLQNALDAKNLGANGLLVVTPYYVKPSENGVIAHMEQIAKSDLPIMFYYHPPRTGLVLSEACIERVLRVPGVVAIKDATNNLDWVSKLQTEYFAGDDSAAKSVMQAGGQGVVSVVANLFPAEWTQAVSLGNGFKRFDLLLKALALETNPQCIKYAMSKMGLCNASLRLPLMEPSRETKEAIDFAMSNSFTFCSSNS